MIFQEDRERIAARRRKNVLKPIDTEVETKKVEEAQKKSMDDQVPLSNTVTVTKGRQPAAQTKLISKLATQQQDFLSFDDDHF